MIDAVPSPLFVNVQPNLGPMGQPAQIDIVNLSSTTAITGVDLFIPISTGPQITIVDTCPAVPTTQCSMAPFAVQPGYSKPITIRCPGSLGANDDVAMSMTIMARYADSTVVTDAVTITCAARATFDLYSTNHVFPTTQTGMSSDGTIRVTSGFASLTPITIHPLTGDVAHFAVTSCVNPPCVTNSMMATMIDVRCTPLSPGPHVAMVRLEGSNSMSTSTLTCNGIGMAIDPSGDGANDGGPDGGGPGGGGGGGALDDPQSFYACSASIAGGLPIVIAVVLAMLRRRR